GGALPGRGDKPTTTAAATDNSAEVARLRQEADAAKAEAAAAKTNAETATASVRQVLVTAGVANADRPAEAVRGLVTAKAASDNRVRQLTAEANKSRDAANLARQEAEAAKKNVADAQNAVEKAKADLANAAKAADARLADARAAAEAKEKEALTKITELAKREEEYAKAADAAKKAAEDAARARDASEGTLKAIGDRLAKARFVGEKPDGAALVKGLDDALKAVSTDATASLREELVKARDQEAKLKADLSAAREKEAAADKTATALRAEAQKLQDQVKAADQKVTNETAKLKTENERLARQAADAIANAQAATKVAEAAKAEADRVAADTARLRSENDRLARDLEAVRELAELIRSPAVTTGGPVFKPDPVKLAERFFADGVRAYYAGRYPEAESALRKAIQFNGEDARYHYLLGLTLWMKKDLVGAEAEFEKGRDMELAGRPSSRVISAVLERFQGPARQAMNVYRP
ncbi:MAG TPA: hypothetical protein VKD90_00785, partial [Gemmataceae bacterium]|nr:hypothetical protein [Gemmataceae bacterium]